MTLKVISLFSGIGAFEKALNNIGIDVDLVNYCEIDKFAAEAYSAIHNIDVNKNLIDISSINTDNFSNDIDLITYGFPCQSVSVAGKQEGIKIGTRSGLLFEAERIINVVQPKYAIAENVLNLVGKKFKKDFLAYLKRLESYGYKNYWTILNSRDLGNIQARRRVFIISIRNDINKSMSFDYEYTKKQRVLEDYLEKNYNKKYVFSDQTIESTNHNGTDKFLIIPDESKGIQLANTFYQYEHKSGWKKEIPTLLAGDYKNPKIIFDPNINTQYKIRKVTPLECFRFMGFDDNDYIKSKKRLEERFYYNRDKSDSQMYKMAGNSIVVDVLEFIFKELFDVV